MAANAFSDLLGRIRTSPPRFLFFDFDGLYRPRNLHRMGGKGRGVFWYSQEKLPCKVVFVLDIPPNHPTVGVSLDEILLGATYSALAKQIRTFSMLIYTINYFEWYRLK